MYKTREYIEDDIGGDRNTANLLRSVKEQEAQFEKLSKQMEMERQNVARQLEKVKTNSDAASVSSVSDTDDSFVWRTHTAGEIDSDNESHNSSALVDSCMKVLEERGMSQTGERSMSSSATDNRYVTKTTTKRVVQNQSYQTTTNGIDDLPTGVLIKSSTPVQRSDSRSSHGSATQINGVRPNESFTSGGAIVRTPSNTSSRSGRGDPYTSSHSTVVTSVTSDGALITTYTTRTTTIQEEPTTRITKQYIVRASESNEGPEMETGMDARTYSAGSSRVTTTSTRQSSSSSTLPRDMAKVQVSKPVGPATLPRGYRPVGTSTPEVKEEEKVNPDGSKVRIVSTTTHVMEKDEPVVEVTICPYDFIETSRSTTKKTTSRTSSSSLEEPSIDRGSRSTKSPNGYFIEEEVTETSQAPVEQERSVFTDRDVSVSEEIVRSSSTRGSSRSTSSTKAPTDRPPAYRHGSSASSSGRGGRRDVIEETVTVVTSDTVESAVDGASGATGGAQRAYAVHNDYDDDVKKVRHDYEIDLLDLKLFLQTDDLALKANAAGYIQHLCYNDNETKIKIQEMDIIPILVELLKHENEDVHRNAAGALKNLSYGKFLDDNKTAIQNCNGIPACVKLLYATRYLEVREYVTGILYNLSSALQCRAELLDESVEAVAVLIVIPLSGWQKSLYLDGRLPSAVLWSTVLRNSIGVLRNTSAAGIEGRRKIRQQEGLVDALVWMLRAALASENTSDVNNKIVENIVCTLRNISYRIDLEIDRKSYEDATRFENTEERSNSLEDTSLTSPGKRRPGDAVGTGCIFMKKKPDRMSRKSRKKAREQPVVVPVGKRYQYVAPKRDEPPLGIELIWDPETVDLYIAILKRSNNPVTLEAAAGAIHNLVACQWNWAGLLRGHVRRQEGLRPIFELLSVEQEYLVRAVALALRNLALDERNKELTGKYAMQEMLAMLPLPSSPEGETEPSEYTICAILGALQVITHASQENCKSLYDHGGVKKLIALTREKDPKREKQLRTYSQRVILDSNRVLMQLWEFKEFQEPIKKELWSHSKAIEEEKAFKTATLKQPKKPKRDNLAEMEENQTDIPLRRDSRRFVMIEDRDEDERQVPTLKRDISEDQDADRNAYELKERAPPQYEENDENDPLMAGKGKKEKGKDKKAKKAEKENAPVYAKPNKPKKSSKSRSKSEEDEEDGEGSETTPLYTNPVYKGKSDRQEDTVKLQDGTQADSWV